jgi:hypothetical protein
VSSNDGSAGDRASGSNSPTDAEEFVASLNRRREAANQLEDDLLNDVPMLYGLSSRWGTTKLAEIRRDEMRRRSGEDPEAKPEALPFERATAALTVLLFLFALVAKFMLRRF